MGRLGWQLDLESSGVLTHAKATIATPAKARRSRRMRPRRGPSRKFTNRKVRYGRGFLGFGRAESQLPRCASQEVEVHR